jgi:hypothetical protein
MKKQIGGDHYAKRNIQPWDVIEEYEMDFWEGNALKYLMIWKDKDGVKDLEKCKHYVDYLIAREKEKNG